MSSAELFSTATERRDRAWRSGSRDLASGDLRLAPRPPVDDRVDIDLDAATSAVTELLVALGLDPTTEELSETPRRAATAMAELLTPRPFRLTTFPNEGYDELVVVRDIPFHSICAHHLLPFVGVAHVGYVPADRIAGLSKLARVVEHFACRPQTQERLTRQIVDVLESHLDPHGAGVTLEATHLCMTVRGVQSSGAKTVTTALTGSLRDDGAMRAEFLTAVRNS